MSLDTVTFCLVHVLLMTCVGITVMTSLVGALDDNDTDTTSILRRLLNESNMDPRIRPNVDGGPVEVHCGFFVVSFGSVSEVNMDYTMNIYLRQEWQDERMVFNKAKVLSLSAKAIDKMWTPDLFFPNEKQASFHVITTPNQLMKIYPNGTIMYSIRLTLKLSCPMNLESFPMDHQICHFKMESFAMNTDEMTLHWFLDTPIEVSPNVELPQFDLVNWTNSDDCETSYKSTGTFPCLRASFKLQRQFGFFLLQTYVPTILIVILSWVSFWINMEAVPARISLGVTTVLTMATQLSGSKQAIPRVSYPKAIDVWMSMCMLFVFLALVEYAFVNALSRKYKPEKQKPENDDITESAKAPQAKEEELPRGLQLLNIRRVMNHRYAARILDKTSRYLFPAIFVVFNIVYWPVYLNHKLWQQS